MSAQQPKPDPNESDLAGKDPLEVLRAALAISAEDAKHVREDAAAKTQANSLDDSGGVREVETSAAARTCEGGTTD
jgi:hypothetical protein